MGSQVPDRLVSFGVSFGRALLTHPDYNSIGLFSRYAWFEANLAATERDGWFAVRVVELRIDQAWGLVDPLIVPSGVLEAIHINYGMVWQELVDQGMIAPLTGKDGWYRIVGWEKYQAGPDRAERAIPGETPEDRARRLARDRKRRQRSHGEDHTVTPVTESRVTVTPVTPVTPSHGTRARTSVSSSSSVSKTYPAHTREGREEPNVTTPRSVKEVLEKIGGKFVYRPPQDEAEATS